MKDIIMNDNDIAIIGIACHFPGCDTVDEYWDNLKNGVNSITQFSKEELRKEGLPDAVLNNPNYVRARGKINDIDKFDADFFDFSPLEASALDPQHRFLLSTSWEAIEHAGYNPLDYDGQIGMFAGCGFNHYVRITDLFSNKRIMDSIGGYNLVLLSDTNFVATRVSYNLNLKGPSFAVQTACSTSLTAIHNACRSLQAGDCDMAMAGAVTLMMPQESGHMYQEGMVNSKDGYCRPFDKDASGFVEGNGVGVVVLKLAKDALEDGDMIHTIIKGSAINNDGNEKISFSAPTIEGESGVIAEALRNANISADDIDYVETHGTGTKLGDPIEFEGLKKAFSDDTERKGYCAIGSVKSNIGHMDTAAGMGGLIKTALALKHGKIPPSLNFSEPNPLINFEQSPFYVNTELRDWPERDFPSRAGVSAFGIGGTNAHVVLEKGPVQNKASKKLENYNISFSAKTKESLANYVQKFSDHLNLYPNQDIANIAYTLQVGRVSFENRLTFVCKNREELQQQLKKEIENNSPIKKHWFVKKNDFDPLKLERDLKDLIFDNEDLIEDKQYKKLGTKIIDACEKRGLFIAHQQVVENNTEEYFYELLTNIWLQGIKIPWQEIHIEQDYYRIPLPTYCFDKKRHWIEPMVSSTSPSNKLETAAVRKPQSEWYYKKVWKQQDLPTEVLKEDVKPTYLIFDDHLGFSKKLSNTLNEEQCIHVKIGTSFKKEHEMYSIDPKKPKDVTKLISFLVKDGVKSVHILHAFGISESKTQQLTKELFSASQITGFYNLLNLVQTISSHKEIEIGSLIALCNHMHLVSKNDMVSPEKSTIQNFINGLSQEYPKINTKCIDIDMRSDILEEQAHLIASVSEEINTITADKAIAYRKGKRWVLDIESVAVTPKNALPSIKEGGAYIITGGLGNIGLATAEFISRTLNTTIILTSRSQFLEEEKWEQWLEDSPEDLVSLKIRKLQQLQKTGANVICMKADVGDYEQMSTVFKYAKGFNGTINGVIHAAGSISHDHFKLISDCDRALCEAQFTSKVYGTLIIAELVKEEKLDFCFLMSSIAVVLGGLKMMPYAAANGFMDAFLDSNQLQQPHANWITVNWDGWHFEENKLRDENYDSDAAEIYLSKKEGIAVFETILSNSIEQLIVSTTNLENRLDNWIRKMPLKKHKKASNKEIPVFERVAALLKDFLQIESISAEDNFFELGGNSLLSVSFVSALNEEFDSDIPVSILIEEPTLEDLTSYIKTNVISLSEDRDQLPFNLVRLKKGSSEKPPLFFIHPVGGSVFFYQDIVSQLPEDQMVYGIQASGLDGFHTAEDNLVNMAQHYVKLVQSIQPSGTYFIGGASFGGMVAYEMAKQLLEKGEQIKKVFMIDTPSENLMPDSSLTALDHLMHFLLAIGKDINIDKDELSKMSDSEKMIFFKNILNDSPEMGVMNHEDLMNVFNANMKAMQTYKVTPLDIEGVYFYATKESEISALNMQKGWKKQFLKGLETIPVEGDHLLMNYLPNSSVISASLSKLIREEEALLLSESMTSI